jgi:formamidopyrimidine-DNA glycosylase
MFELPECMTLARQINTELEGRRITHGSLGNSPHKFVWYNRSQQEFESLSANKLLGRASARGRWIFIPFEPGCVLLIGECGGRLLYHPPGAEPPAKYHLRLDFDDGSSMTVTTQMWGAMELHEGGSELDRDYVKGMRATPVEKGFTLEYFSELVDSTSTGGTRSVKGLLTQNQLIPGLGNSIAQEIMFRAQLHSRHPLKDLDSSAREGLYSAIVNTVAEVTAAGGRSDEMDLYGRPGGYDRVMDNRSVGRPCPVCGTPIEKISYLGGSCYLCPSCQK